MSQQAQPESPELAFYWKSANEGKLAIKQCLSCERTYFYPRPLCPLCGSGSTTWATATGRGTIYSFSIVRNARRPTAAAIVELDEGPRVTTALLDCDVHALQIGDAVEVDFERNGAGHPALAFTTAAAQMARRYSSASLKDSEFAPELSPGGDVAEFKQAAVVGAGTMGSGIATALLQADVPITLIDSDPAAFARASQQIRKAFESSVSRGRMSQDQANARMAALSFEKDLSHVRSADLIIEAVYEQMALKKAIFAELDRHAKPGATLGSNTSTLDIDEIASATRRPESVIGLHFFSPAHVMKLLEVVRGARTDDSTIRRAMALGRRLGKVSVLVRVCDGFVGNRLMIARERQAGALLVEGALPDQVDRVLREFGLPMGTFELQDLAGGIELDYRRRQSTGAKDYLVDRLFELGRLGQKTGKGYYSYEPTGRKPQLDEEIIEVIEAASRHYGVLRRKIPDREVRERLILPMVNEAAKLIEEGVVIRPSDVDVVWRHGYGWPAWKGGPVYWADSVGIGLISDRLHALHESHGAAFEPAALLKRLAADGGRLLDAKPGALRI